MNEEMKKNLLEVAMTLSQTTITGDWSYRPDTSETHLSWVNRKDGTHLMSLLIAKPFNFIVGKTNVINFLQNKSVPLEEFPYQPRTYEECFGESNERDSIEEGGEIFEADESDELYVGEFEHLQKEAEERNK